MIDKQDRRFRRTNRLLIAALMELTSERDYDSIQVRDITERADVGYATFYRHYESKDALMLIIFEMLMAELESSTRVHPDGYFLAEGKNLFAHVAANRGLYASIIQSPPLVKILKKQLSTRISGHLAVHPIGWIGPVYRNDLAAYHMATGVLGLIEWWLGRNLSPGEDEMAVLYDRLIIQATWYGLDFTKQPVHS